jgi:predicted ATPase
LPPRPQRRSATSCSRSSPREPAGALELTEWRRHNRADLAPDQLSSGIAVRVPGTFVVAPRRFSRADLVPNVGYLEVDNWDDWGRYATLFRLWISDDDATLREIGYVKVGERGMPGGRTPQLRPRFDRLGDEFFSLGQDLTYFENLNSFGENVRSSILERLRDIASDPAIFELAIREEVTQRSLLRSVTRLSVEGQFRRVSRGLPSLTSYHFTFDVPAWPGADGAPVLEFIVEPDSQPPTNVHAIIGPNGVGKSTILDLMARDLGDSPDGEQARFSIRSADTPNPPFANVIAVSFSAFDTFDSPDALQEQSRLIRRARVGLRRADGRQERHDLANGLADEFAVAYEACQRGSRARLLGQVLEDLGSDPIFADVALGPLNDRRHEQTTDAREVFSALSTGHKVALLALTRLVELVEERSLVLFDEPEAHLHPPLLAAFVRTLSRLVADRNGVAILATHSPVVLQELPSSCVHILRRSGVELRADRPMIETFGENLGTLTREVFGYEVTATGFHRDIRNAAERGESFEDIRRRFDGQLGSEAQAIARALTVRQPD